MKKPTPPQPDTVRVSSDYDRFVPHGQQRITKTGHVKKLMNSMRELGFIPSSPIAVIKDADKFRIVDGHHRFAAAKSLGIPLYFLILSKDLASAVGGLNIGKPWTCVEWANKFTLDGRPAYLTLNRYVAKGIPMQAAAGMLTGRAAGTGGVTNILTSGDLTIKDTAQIDLICKFKEDLEGSCPAVGSLNFIEALSMCYFVQDFDPRQLKARISARPMSLLKTATRQQMLEQIEKVYNHQSHIKMPLAFLAREVAKSRMFLKPGKTPKAPAAEDKTKPAKLTQGRTAA